MSPLRPRVTAADGTELHAEVTGDGPTVLLIQGLGYATWGWSRTVPTLAGRFRTVAFDNRGAGRSDKPDEPYSIELLSDDALAVLEAVGEPPAHVVGFSLGGYVALMLARRHPDAVRSLVLLSTSCGGHGSWGLPRATRAAWEAASTLEPPAYARKTMPLSFAPGWAKQHPAEFDQLLEMRLVHPTPPFAWRHQFEAAERFLEQGIDPRTVAHPTLVVHGTKDRVLPFANGKLLAARIPGATLLRLEGAGHLALIERADEVNRAILEFLS
jgi:pimeloyl-ACP methyl ester carboxylesterase